MGLLRLLLALSVVLAHAEALRVLPIMGAPEAVRIFFAISGFYMAEIWKGYRSAREFLFARALRIVPVYMVVLALSVVVTVAIGVARGDWGALSGWIDQGRNGTAGRWIATLSNLTLVGQDWILFLTHPAGGSLGGIAAFRHDVHPLHEYLFVPQAWSVGVELVFYLSVPWALGGRSWRRWVLLLASAAARLALAASGFLEDPWEGRFMPSEFFWFVGGILAHDLARASRWQVPRVAPWGRTLLVIGVFLGLGILSRLLVRAQGAGLAIFIPGLVWLGVLPLLFSISRDSRLDRWLGELSFPVYLVHLLVLRLLDPLGNAMGAARIPVVVVASLGCALALRRHVVDPLEARRKLLARRWAGG